MAILDSLPGIEVTVESQGRSLQEYEDGNDWKHDELFNISPERRTSVYVECVSDAEFSIECSMKPPYRLDRQSQMLTFDVTLDGQGVCRTSTRKVVYGYWQTTVAFSSRWTGPNEVATRKFKFAGIQKVDDADSSRVKDDAQVVKNGLGEILVAVYRSCKGQGNELSHIRAPFEEAPAQIAEKALKGQALSHGIGFGAEEHKTYSAPVITYLDDRKSPIAVFAFKYRSREALQQEHIIPRSPSPEMVMPPLNSRNANHNQLSRDERLAKLQREIDAIKSEVKSEDDENSGRKPSASTVLMSGRETIHKRKGNTVIDLTDDE